MKKVFLFLLFLFADLFAFEIECAPVDIDSAFIRLQALNFLKVFPSVELKNGTYIFYEKNGSRKLFYYGEDKDALVMYQYPMQKESRWLNPKGFLKERNQIEQKKTYESICKYEFENARALIKTLDSFNLNQFPYIWVESNKEMEFPLIIQNSAIWGFVKGASTEYFYFRDMRDFLEAIPSSFNVYVDMFNFFETGSFQGLLKDCK